MVRGSVGCAADTMAEFDAVIPVPPLGVTGTVAPAAPWFGVTELTVTDAAATVNPPASTPLPPPGFVTVTFRAASAAPLAIVSVAVSCVGDVTVRFDTAIPVPTLRLAPAANPEQLTATETAAPGVP